MASPAIATARPRSAGEILDDAWRLYLADVPALLLLTGLFLAPAFGTALLLIARPAAGGAGRWLLAAAAAALAAATGYGSGACQEYFRRRSDGTPAGVGTCLLAAGRRAGGHVAVRAVVLGVCGIGVFGFVPHGGGTDVPAIPVAAILGTGYLLLLAPLLWTATATAHVVLARPERPADPGGEVTRAARLDGLKAAVIVLSRVPVLVLAFFNLHLLVIASLWVAVNLGGFDLSLVSAGVSLRSGAYDVALAMLCWMLLAPYFEASNYLLYLDARSRQEGLDLLEQVRRAFPAVSKAGAAGLAVALLALRPGPVRAAEDWPTAVHDARVVIAAVAAEVEAADPYPGGGRWEPRLREATKKLAAAAADGKQRRVGASVRRALDGFARQNRPEALHALREVRDRLELAEEESTPPDASAAARPARSRADIKKLVRPETDEPADAEPARPAPRKAEEPKVRPAAREGAAPAEHVDVPAGTGSSVPSALGMYGGLLVLGVLLGILGVAAIRYWASLPETPAKPKEKPAELPALPTFPRPDEQPAPVLWKQAEDLNRAGRHHEAVRSLYLAVLSLLHVQRLLRYETTRTNGEYVRQVRLAPQAPAGLAEPFEYLTRQFEELWYGIGASTAADYQACRGLAEQVRALAQG